MDKCYFCKKPLRSEASWMSCREHFIVNSGNGFDNVIYHFSNRNEVDYFVFYNEKEYRFVYNINNLIVYYGTTIISTFDLDKVKHVIPETSLNFLIRILSNKAFI